MRKVEVSDVGKAVEEVYGTFNSSVEEGRQQLAEMRINIKSWFESSDRQITPAANYCISRFVDGELDHVTAGVRGYGRIGEQVPRFAARHRTVFAKLPADLQERLSWLIRRHILCGYFFAELVYELGRGNERSLSSSQLFEMWAPSIYSSQFGQLLADGGDERDVREIWYEATATSIGKLMLDSAANLEELDQVIVTYYFDGGMILRILEANPLTEDQLSTIVTGGISPDAAKAIAQQGSSGCLLMFAFFTVLCSGLTACGFIGQN